jgi:hypothetical protein
LNAANANTPTGMIDFYDDDVLLGSQPVSTSGCGSGVAFCASFGPLNFTVGVHRLFAVYEGDTNFAGSVSATTDLQRHPRPKPR